MISKMSCAEIVGPIDKFETALNAVQEAGVLHIEEVPVAEYGEQAELHRIHLSEEDAQKQRIAKNLVDMLDEAVEYIPSSTERKLRDSHDAAAEYAEWDGEPLSSLSSTARVLHAKIRSFKRRERNLSDDLQVLSSYEEVITALAPLIEGNVLPEEYEYLGVILEQRAHTGRRLLESELSKVTNGQYRFFESALTKGRIAALLGFHREYRDQVRRLVERAGISEMTFPRHLRDKPFEEAFALLEDELEQLRERKQQLEEQAERFYDEKGAKLFAIRRVCRDIVSRYEAISKFARTEYTFIMKGWVLKRELPRLRKHLADVVGNSVVLRELNTSDIGSPPVVLDNPGVVKNFEPLLGLMPPPTYGSLDPTLFMALSFPPIFGLMLGDIGYGAVLLAVSALLYALGKPGSLLRRLSVVGSLCAAFTVAFGVFFGEMFGTLGHDLGLQPIWRERFPVGGEGMRQSLMGYLFIAGAVGLVHITIGHILGMINAGRRGDESEIWTNAARLDGLYLLILVVGTITEVLPEGFVWGAIATAVVFALIMFYETLRYPTHGLLLPLEVLSSMSNVFSYARIFAIGMASVVLAFLANMFGGMITNVIFAAIVVILIHGLNMVLGVVDPTIQGMRLHYVEFFTKFYRSGGKPYTPFRKLRNELKAAA